MSDPAETPRPPPRVAILMLAYQQRHFIDAAVRSVLAQEGGPWDIWLSDDASTDGTFERMQELAASYRGPHRVHVRRNERNLGIGAHYNALVEAADADLMFTAAGDDVSLPHRVIRCVQAWEAADRRPDLIAAHVIDLDAEGRCHAVMKVDDLGEWTRLEQWKEQRPYVIGAAQAFTRRQFERFGPLPAEVFYEDQIFTFRALAMGGAITVDEALVHYRRGGTSRRPKFEDVEFGRRWTIRQLSRELAEHRTLMADACRVGWEEPMRAYLDHDHRRKRFHFEMLSLERSADRWRLAWNTRDQPFWWRMRKALHRDLPNLSHGIREWARRRRCERRGEAYIEL